jgi:[acyl-carrier-protein] S-malonyltransferase
MSFAFVFPGQGSQSVGMLASLAALDPVVRATFDEASPALGYDLWTLVQEGPAERLNSTEVTQPAMLVAGIATARLWSQRGGAEPAVVAGHSLGEFTALVVAGVLDFSTATALVKFRGQVMQEAVPAGVGAMAAIIGLKDADVETACREAAQGAVVEAVNFNSPGQVVIAGHAAAVERAVDLAKAAGELIAVMLPVSAPFHCALMRPAQQRLAADLDAIEFRDLEIPLVNNAWAKIIRTAGEAREGLKDQVPNPVRWEESIRLLASEGVDRFVEVGPGRVLAGLLRSIDRSLTGQSVGDVASLEKLSQ